MPDIQDAPAIEQALAIPLQPARGLVLGPIRVTEPSSDPVFRRPTVLPARLPVGRPQPDLLHRIQADPASPSVRPALIPETSAKADSPRRAHTETALPPSTVSRTEIPASPPKPDPSHRAQSETVAPSVRPAPIPATPAKPIPPRRTEAETTRRPPVAPRSEVPGGPPRPDLLHRTAVDRESTVPVRHPDTLAESDGPASIGFIGLDPGIGSGKCRPGSTTSADTGARVRTERDRADMSGSGSSRFLVATAAPYAGTLRGPGGARTIFTPRDSGPGAHWARSDLAEPVSPPRLGGSLSDRPLAVLSSASSIAS